VRLPDSAVSGSLGSVVYGGGSDAAARTTVRGTVQASVDKAVEIQWSARGSFDSSRTLHLGNAEHLNTTHSVPHEWFPD